MACDICGRTGTSLVELLEGYKTAEITHICPECEKTVNAHLSKVKDLAHTMTRTLLKRFMAVLKGQRADERACGSGERP